jgi:hypothetical protein
LALGEDQRDEIETQALSIGWAPNKAGQKEVDNKEKVKKTLKKSPDELEALIIAFYEAMPPDTTRDDAIGGDEVLNPTRTYKGGLIVHDRSVDEDVYTPGDDSARSVEEAIAEDVYDPMGDFFNE